MDISKLEVAQVVSIGYVSLVGIMKTKYPLEYGNYFSMVTADNKEFEISNMWFENLDYLIKQEVVSFPIQVKILGRGWAMVYDVRVPPNFLMETSYRAPMEFWSLRQLANRQLKIDSGEIQLVKDAQGNVIGESQQIKATRRTLNMKYSVESTEGLKCPSFIFVSGK